MTDAWIARDRSELRLTMLVGASCTVAVAASALLSDIARVPTLWPVLGAGVAALVIAGLRHWPGVLAADALRFGPMALGWVPSPGLTGATGVLLALLLLLATITAAALIRRASGGEPPLSTPRGVTALVLGGAVLVCFPLGLLSSWVVALTRPELGLDVFSTALRSWGASGASLLIVSGVILAWWYHEDEPAPGGRIELACLLGALLLVGLALFHGPPWPGAAPLPYLQVGAMFLPGPLMIWAGARLGARRCATGVALLCLLAITSENHGLSTALLDAPGPDLVFFYGLIWSMAVAGYYAAAIARHARSATAGLRASHVELEREVERRTAELRDSQSRLERAQRIARVGDWEWSAGSDQLRYSDEIFHILGYRRGDGSDLESSRSPIAGEEERSAAMAAFRTAARARTRYETLLRVRRADGRIAELEVHGDPLHTADGAFLGMAGTAQDVTERRELEERLRQAQKMEAIGRLAGGIAHDFNNLLTPINGFAELLVDQLGDSPLARDAAEIQRAAERAAALTRQLLTFSRRRPAHPRSIDLNRVLSEMLVLLEHTIGEQIELIAASSAEPVAVRADPHQIEQVILNLVVNARDAMPYGGRITIGTRNEIGRDEFGDPHRFAVLHVEDTGIGIGQDAREYLFEPFFTTKEVGRGTGLGLATVYGIIEQAGGEIRIESQSGLGTSFEVWLPALGELPELDTPRPAAPVPGGGETILIAEDEPHVRGYVKRVLEEQGYRVLESEDAETALSLACEYPGQIDLLVTDMVMPGKSGIDLSLDLRAEQPDLPVLFMTGYADSVLGEHLGARSAAVLSKPFSPAALAENVRRMLDGRD